MTTPDEIVSATERRLAQMEAALNLLRAEPDRQAPDADLLVGHAVSALIDAIAKQRAYVQRKRAAAYAARGCAS